MKTTTTRAEVKMPKSQSTRKPRASKAPATQTGGKKATRAPKPSHAAPAPADQVEIARDDEMAALSTIPTRNNRGPEPEAPQVLEAPFGRDTILNPAASQPLMGTGSGDTWDYQPDPAVEDVLEETEQIQTASGELVDALAEHTDESPVLTGGDIDADWQRADDVGEEAVGGTVATPEQNQVDGLGRAWGVEHHDDEPVHTIDKLEKRDRHRWELNAASGDPASGETAGE